MTEVQKLAKIMVLKDLYKEYGLLAKYNGGIDYDRYCALEMAIKALEQEPEQKGSYHPIISGNSQNPPKVKSAESEE